MPEVLFATESYISRSLPLSAQRCLNFFVEQQRPGAKSQLPLFGAPGLTNFTTAGNGPVRGLWVMKNQLFAVSGDSFYRIDSGGGVTLLGGGIGGGEPVSMADNGYQVCVVNGEFGWIWNANTATWAIISDPNFKPAKTVTFFDDYFVFDYVGTNQFFLSALLDGTSYSGLDFASAQASSAPLVGIAQNLQLLYLFCEDHTELWYDAGAADFPFQRYAGGVVNRGCLAPLTIVKQDEAIFFLGDDKIFYRMQGQFPIRVSTHAIETAIASYPDAAKAFCFTFTLEGHKFIFLTFPDSLHTWVYDISTQRWHERDSWDAIKQPLGRWRGNCCVDVFGGTYIGDAFDGGISLVDWSNYTERGNIIRGLVHSVPFHSDRKRIFCGRMEIDCETGVGLTVGQGSDPQFMLSRSTDGGKNWTQPQLWKSMGKIGETRKLLRWFRQGQGRQMMWELTCTDPVKRVVYAAHADISIGL